MTIKNEILYQENLRKKMHSINNKQYAIKNNEFSLKDEDK